MATMTRALALKDLQAMLTACQKSRSDLTETMGDGPSANLLKAELSPWLFGHKSIVPTLLRFLDRSEKGASIAGADFYNFMWVASREPSIGLVALAQGHDLPKPDLAWMGKKW